jgi:hypothetical protein
MMMQSVPGAVATGSQFTDLLSLPIPVEPLPVLTSSLTDRTKETILNHSQNPILSRAPYISQKFTISKEQKERTT